MLKYLSTIIICLLLAGIVAAIIVYLVRNKKQGKSSCSGGCSRCAMHGTCHSQQKK